VTLRRQPPEGHPGELVQREHLSGSLTEVIPGACLEFLSPERHAVTPLVAHAGPSLDRRDELSHIHGSAFHKPS